MPKAFKKYGLTDDYGNVIIPPIFDEIIVNDYFIIGKFRGVWELFPKFDKPENFSEDSFEDVKVFGNVLWYKKDGRWGAKDSEYKCLVPEEYRSIRVMDEVTIIEAIEFGNVLRYFTTEGRAIGRDINSLQIGEFKFGYAIASGYLEPTDEKRYFVVSGIDAMILDRDFTNYNECVNWVEDLRSDYVWSMRRNNKK